MPGERGLKASIESLFETSDLYGVLGAERSATEAELKRAYHKKSLIHHPDRPGGDKERFQALGAVYKLLSDKDRRAVYDETGDIDEGDDMDPDRDWDQYWRLLFKKITLADIAKFEEEYKGSEEELADLKAAYLDGDGDMNYIMDNVLCAVQEEDEERFAGIIRKWIADGDVPDLKKFSKESAKKKKERKRRAEGERQEAEEAAKELGLGNGASSLANMIAKRQEQRAADADGFLDHLAAKYGGGSGKKKGKKK